VWTEQIFQELIQVTVADCFWTKILKFTAYLEVITADSLILQTEKDLFGDFGQILISANWMLGFQQKQAGPSSQKLL
jgi:hypothetical protein